MAIINLLPTDFAPTGPVARFTNILRGSVILGFILFVILLLALIGIFIFNSINLSATVSRENQLKDSIKALSATEQKFVLVKDRVARAKEILDRENASEAAQKLEQLLAGLPEVSLTQSEIVAGKSELNFLATTPAGLANLLTRLKTSGLFQAIVLSSLNFNPTTGYQVNITGTKK